MRSTKDRLMEFVTKTPSCWLWNGSISPTGYGRFALKTNKLAHRVSYEVHCGDIPLGKCVLHKCDVRNCVNPKHLWIGTYQDNCIDMFKKGRRKTKLNKQKAEEIRKLYNSGNYSLKDLAKKYGVNVMNISLIKRNLMWKK